MMLGWDGLNVDEVNGVRSAVMSVLEVEGSVAGSAPVVVDEVSFPFVEERFC